MRPFQDGWFISIIDIAGTVRGNFGQMGYPHTTSDKNGKYTAFNAVKNDRINADAYVVELQYVTGEIII